MMEEGIVTFWRDAQGYGFIRRDGKPDIFIHYSDVSGKWRPDLGDKVAFDIEADARGRLRAVNVQLIYRYD